MKKLIRKIVSKSYKTIYPNKGTFYCPVCDTSNVAMHPLDMFWFENFQKYQHIYNIFFAETLNLAHYTCAKCGAADRDRLYALYLKKYFAQSGKISFLDIAPAKALKKFIKSHANVSYRSMDLYMEDVDDNVDITKMDIYKDGQFDFFICSHVLEHIPDDKKAMAELYRILKPGGKAIVMVPINSTVQKTHEEPNMTDVAYRWKYFGQDDHIRIYEKSDFIARLNSVGFKVELLDKNYFTEETFNKCAVYLTSVLYIVSN